MTTMLSLILAFMLSIGGSPAASVNPAGCPGNTGIQAPIDNNRTINSFFENYREKTASRPISKKILEIPLIKQPKTQMRLRFSLSLKEELRLMGYMDSMNLYQAFNMNPVNFTDPFGLFDQLHMQAMNNEKYMNSLMLTDEQRAEAARGLWAFTRNAAMCIGIAIIAVKSIPVAVAVGSYFLIKGVGDSLNARLDAGQTWEESKRGTIVDFATLGGYTPITGWDAGTGDAVQVTSEHWGNFTGNVVGIASGWNIYKSMSVPVKNTTPMIRINLNNPKFSGYLMDITPPSTIGTPTLIAIEEYSVLSNNSSIPGQTHHLNQNAAYNIVIPPKKGVSIKLEGNVFTDIGTPHYRFHANLERFWSQFRRGGSRYGEVPTNLEYTKAVFDSLVEIGFSYNDAVTIINSVIKQRVQYGLLGGEEIPRIPGKINQRR